MEEEQLDLFQLAAGGATQFGARAAKIVWSDAGNSDFGRVLPEHMPDDLLAQVLAGNRARAVHGSEDVPSGNARRGSPGIDCDFHPIRHGRGTNSPVLPDQIDDAPASITLLDVRESQRRDF